MPCFLPRQKRIRLNEILGQNTAFHNSGVGSGPSAHRKTGQGRDTTLSHFDKHDTGLVQSISHMSALKMYVDYLLALASEAEAQPTEPLVVRPSLTGKNIANFLQAFLRLLDKQEKTTRSGVDVAIETLFAHPDMAPLLDDVTAITFQRQFVIDHLPLCSPLFRNYWSHVITPAWNQLRDVRRMMNYTTP